MTITRSLGYALPYRGRNRPVTRWLGKNTEASSERLLFLCKIASRPSEEDIRKAFENKRLGGTQWYRLVLLGFLLYIGVVMRERFPLF